MPDSHALQEHVLALAKPPRRWRIPSFPSITTRRVGHTTIVRQLLTRMTGQKSRFQSLAGETVTVEVRTVCRFEVNTYIAQEVALEHYTQPQKGQPRWKGVHTENGVWAMLFSMLLWDAIWAEVPDVFHSPFQCTIYQYDIRSHLYSFASRLGPRLLLRNAQGCHRAVSVTDSNSVARGPAECSVAA